MASPPSSGAVRHSGNRGLLAAVTPAIVFSAASGYVVLLLAARVLGADGYELFAVYWGGFFAIVAVLGGLSNETTRSVYGRARGRGQGRGARPFRLAWGVGVAAAVVTWLTSPLWAERLIPGHERVGTLLLAVALVSLGPQLALMGILAGLQRWRLYAVGILVDAGLRVIVAVVATAMTTPEVGFIVATVSGALTWLVLVMLSRDCRGVLGVGGDVGTRSFCLRTAKAMLAGAAAAMLIVGFPTLLKITAPATDPEILSALILAVTLTRAPLLVPMLAFQSALVVHFGRRGGDPAGLAKILALVAAATLVGAWLGALVGPGILAWMGEGFVVEGGVLAGLMLGAGALALTLLSGYAALARELHTSYALGWWLAAVVVVLVLLMPLDLETRVVAALVAGPLLGSGYHVGAIVLSGRS